MKKYFVASYIHSFYTPFIKELNKTGFDLNNEEHSSYIVTRKSHSLESVYGCLAIEIKAVK